MDPLLTALVGIVSGSVLTFLSTYLINKNNRKAESLKELEKTKLLKGEELFRLLVDLEDDLVLNAYVNLRDPKKYSERMREYRKKCTYIIDIYFPQVQKFDLFNPEILYRIEFRLMDFESYMINKSTGDFEKDISYVMEDIALYAAYIQKVRKSLSDFLTLLTRDNTRLGHKIRKTSKEVHEKIKDLSNKLKVAEKRINELENRDT